MASTSVFRGPSFIVSNQPVTKRGKDGAVYKPPTICKIQSFHERNLKSFLFSNSTLQQSRISSKVKSVGEEARTAPSSILEIEDESTLERCFEEAGDKLVVLDISTRTCGPCKFIYPKLVKMSKEYPDAVFLKINGDLNSDTRALMRKWGIRSVPTFRFYRKAELIHSHTGANEDELRTHFLVHYSPN